MSALLREMWNDDCGASMTEYAMLLAIVSLTLMGAIQLLAGGIVSTFESASSGLSAE